MCGVIDDGMRKLLLRDSELTLAKVIALCQIHEQTDLHTKTLAMAKSNTIEKELLAVVFACA